MLVKTISCFGLLFSLLKWNIRFSFLNNIWGISKKKRRVIDLGPENTIEQLIHELCDYDEMTNTISPQVNMSLLGLGGGISGGSVSKTKR